MSTVSREAPTRDRAHASAERTADRPDGALAPATLVVGSASSAAAAIVVHELWRAGTILGAALTPVLVALFAELLRRPAQGVRRHASQPDDTAATRVLAAAVPYRVHRVRPRWTRVLATGLTAFALGAGALTLSETLLQRSVADSGTRSTLFDDRRDARVRDHRTSGHGGAPPVDSAGPRVERTPAVHEDRGARRSDARRPAPATDRSTATPGDGRPTSERTPARSDDAAARGTAPLAGSSPGGGDRVPSGEAPAATDPPMPDTAAPDATRPPSATLPAPAPPATTTPPALQPGATEEGGEPR